MLSIFIFLKIKMSTTNKLVYILNNDSQVEANKQKSEANELALQNIDVDTLISVNLKSDLPYNATEGTYAFVKNMGSLVEPKPGKPVYFHAGNWFDFCCPGEGQTKTAVAERQLEMVIVYAPNVSDMLLTEYNNSNLSFKNAKNNSVFDVSNQQEV